MLGMFKNKYPLFCLGVYIIAFVIGAIKPWYFHDWILESFLPILIVLALVFTYRKFRFSNTSYTLILIYLIFHTIGSHYTYLNMPFTENLFGLERNYYDRFVHFLFGLFMYFPIIELCKQFLKKKSECYYAIIAISAIVTLGFLFELLEGLVYLFFRNTEVIEAYLAAQGRNVLEDSFYDVFVKFIGSLISAGFAYIRK